MSTEFTPSEMELLCVFHAGTRSGTLELLEYAASQIPQPERQEAAKNAAAKLKGLSPKEPVALAFQSEA